MVLSSAYAHTNSCMYAPPGHAGCLRRVFISGAHTALLTLRASTRISRSLAVLIGSISSEGAGRPVTRACCLVSWLPHQWGEDSQLGHLLPALNAAPSLPLQALSLQRACIDCQPALFSILLQLKPEETPDKQGIQKTFPFALPSLFGVGDGQNCFCWRRTPRTTHG